MVKLNDSGFDYEIEHTCQYDVSDTNEACDCGEPAPYKAWWPDSKEPMWLCPEHFKRINAIETEPTLVHSISQNKEDKLVEVIEPVLKKYKDSIIHPQTAGIDFRNFAAHDIIKAVITRLHSLGYRAPSEIQELERVAMERVFGVLEYKSWIEQTEFSKRVNGEKHRVFCESAFQAAKSELLEGKPQEQEDADERYTFLEKGSDIIDEAVLGNALVHLECLDDGCYMLIMTNKRHLWHFNIFSASRRAKVVAKLYEGGEVLQEQDKEGE